MSDDGTRRVIREYKRAHGLPEDGKIGQQLLMDNGLELRIAGRFGFGGLARSTLPNYPIWQSHFPQKVVFYRPPDEEKSIHESFFQRRGIKVGLRRLY